MGLPPVRESRARGKGMGFALRAIDAESTMMTAVQRSKSHEFTSRVSTQRSSHACRSCENDCMTPSRHCKCTEAATAATVSPNTPNVLQAMVQLEQANWKEDQFTVLPGQGMRGDVCRLGRNGPLKRRYT